MDDLIYRQAAIDALGERPMTWTGGDYELGVVNQYDADVLALEKVPSAQPTFYGYDMKHLAFVAFIMAKEGVRPEEAVATFLDISRSVEIAIKEIKEIANNDLKQAMDAVNL